MAEEVLKPFACNIDGCQMTFMNEDHLTWHSKKHDIVLNLGIANINAEVVDQTPTPTRFIRNCEEVGLFQDLQNVNPFDETFKKAVESVKAGTLHVPEPASNDDTLHTPHIFPHVEENTDKFDSTDQTTQSTDFCIASVASIQENNNESSQETYGLAQEIQQNDKQQTEQNNCKKLSLKDKLKETIISKGKITPVPLEKLKITNIESPKPTNKTNSKKRKTDDKTDEKEKIREMNRAAQFRCRKRKRIKWDKMEDDLKNLRKENLKLSQENLNYRHKICALRELILIEKKDGVVKNNFLLSKIEGILDMNAPPKRGPLTSNPIPILRHRPVKKTIVSPLTILPLPAISPQGQGQKPVLIQVLGSVSQLALSVFPNK